MPAYSRPFFEPVVIDGRLAEAVTSSDVLDYLYSTQIEVVDAAAADIIRGRGYKRDKTGQKKYVQWATMKATTSAPRRMLLRKFYAYAKHNFISFPAVEASLTHHAIGAEAGEGLRTTRVAQDHYLDNHHLQVSILAGNWKPGMKFGERCAPFNEGASVGVQRCNPATMAADRDVQRGCALHRRR